MLLVSQMKPPASVVDDVVVPPGIYMIIYSFKWFLQCI